MRETQSKEYRFTYPQLAIILQTEAAPDSMIKLYLQKLAQVEPTLSKVATDFLNPKDTLIPQGYLKGITVAVYHAPEGVITDKQRNWIRESGATLYDTSDLTKFLNYLKTNSPNIIWIISDRNIEKAEKIVPQVIEHFLRGASLFIWNDNQPFFAEGNELLRKITNSDCQFQGNYIGDKTLSRSPPLINGHFDSNHVVAIGFPHLYEGVTISYPTKACQNYFIPVCS